MIMNDMPQMCKFVYDFYADKVAAMKAIVKPLDVEPGKIEISKAGHKTSQHPGDDRDSDDEAEGKETKKKEKEEVLIVNEVDMETTAERE